jgi:general stress protein 26
MPSSVIVKVSSFGSRMSPMQPMAHHVDKAGRRLWFLTKRNTEFFQRLRPGAQAQFAVISKNHDFHAFVTGPIREEMNRVFLDEIWSTPTAAWFESKDDPELAMVVMQPERTRIWASTGSSLAYAWEIGRASASEERVPNVGVHMDVSFTG